MVLFRSCFQLYEELHKEHVVAGHVQNLFMLVLQIRKSEIGSLYGLQRLHKGAYVS